MAEQIERNQNSSDSSTVAAGIPTVSNDAITISAANERRTFISVTVRAEDGWIREIPAATDAAVRKGIFLLKGTTFTFPVDDLYKGEVSGINDKNNKNPVFYVTER